MKRPDLSRTGLLPIVNTLLMLVASVALSACSTDAPYEPPRCGVGETSCGGACIRLDAGTPYCGQCFNVCPEGASCTNSACVCPPDKSGVCDRKCVDLQSDPSHCGACGRTCGLGSCVAGECVCDPDPTTVQTCPGSPACVDTARDPANCGSCGQRCGLGSCVDGACVCGPAPVTPCPGSPTCVNLWTDSKNCGACGSSCASSSVCPKGPCECSLGVCCPIGEVSCAGTCVNLETDATSCGACGTRCAAGESCVDGICCRTGQQVCAGKCVDTATDANNCGGCGNVCPSGASCRNGACSCASGQVPCGSSCCEGTACCASGCQVKHANGLGQAFFTCDPLATFTVAAAQQAATAWAAAGTDYPALACGGGACYARQTAAQCSVWCYEGMLAGRVHLNPSSIVCMCPFQSDPNWY